MKKLLQILAMTLVLLGSSKSQAQQVMDYAFSDQYIDTYTPLSNPIVLWSVFDDNISSAIAIPDFTFGGLVYNTMKVQTNGHVALGTYTANTNYNALSGVSGAIISPFAADLNNSSGASHVGYQIAGSLITVEWNNVRRFNVTGESLNFQVVIDIDNNAIYFKYGSMSPGAASTDPQVGMKVGNSFPDQVINRMVTPSNSWLTSANGNVINSSCQFNSIYPDMNPQEGLVYVWQSGISGCMDPTACNYDADAEFSDGSCDYCSCGATCGCTDVAACNYNPAATLDDGSCYSTVAVDAGADVNICIGSTTQLNASIATPGIGVAYNWSPSAGLSNSALSNPIAAPTFTTTYQVTVVDENGCSGSDYVIVYVLNCVPGCVDDFACNYNPDATDDDGSCDYSCFGCMDGIALNFDADATIDDGSCYYLGEGDNCSNPITLVCSQGVYSAMTFGTTNDNTTSGSNVCSGLSTGGQRWYVYEAAFSSEITVSTINALTNFDTYLKVFTGSCGNFTCVVQNDDIPGTGFQSQCVFDAVEGETYYVRVGGFASMQGTFGFTINCGGGCLDPTACNYDVDAPFDDGSCTYGADCYGCTDDGAINYDPIAVYDEGCQYAPSILVFHDMNGDGIHQGNEPGLSNWPVYIAAMNATIFTNASGYAQVLLPASSFTIDLINETTNWISSNSSSVSIVVPSSMSASFGLIPSSGETFLVAGPYDGFWDIIHCTDGYEAGVFLNNTGAVPLNGTLTMTCDASFMPEADAYLTIAPNQVAAGYAQWNISDFLAGANGLFSFHIDGPGTANIGQTYSFEFNMVLLDGDGNEIYNDTWTTTPFVACSYDPNDLTAIPEGYAEPHFILPGQRLQYRVRFQNTGNLPAEDILVIDDLDPQVFDISTFAPMYGSNSYTACLHDDGTIDFIFNDIYLPDAVNNEEGSHGFVVYEVEARSDLIPGTVLYNQADIFFDANPAIITNETFHTIFDCTSFEGISGDMDVCFGNNVMLDAEQNYVESYAWSVDGEDLGDGSNKDLSNLSVGTHEVVMITTNPLCDMTHTATVEVNELPTINAGSDLEVCAGLSVLLAATSNGTVIWGNDIENGSEYSPMNSMEITATATSEFGCVAMDAIQITVYDFPSMTVTQNGATLTAANGIAWQWYVNGYMIADENGQSISGIQPGEYYAQVTGEGGCVVASETITVVKVDEVEGMNIVLYPNPMSQSATLILPAGIHQVRLYDISGREVLNLNNCIGKVEIGRTGLSGGVYQLRILNAQWSQTIELIIE